MAQKVGRREIYSPVPPSLIGDSKFYLSKSCFDLNILTDITPNHVLMSIFLLTTDWWFHILTDKNIFWSQQPYWHWTDNILTHNWHIIGPNFTCTCNCQNCLWISMTLRWFQILIVSTSIQQLTDRWFLFLTEKKSCFALNWTPVLWLIDTCQKNVVHWPVSCDHITGSSLVFIEVMCLVFKLTTDQGLVFSWIAGSCQVNLLKIVWNQVKANQAKYKLYCEQMFCIAFVVYSCLRLFKLQTEGQIIYRKLQNSNQNSCLSWVSLIKL